MKSASIPIPKLDEIVSSENESYVFLCYGINNPANAEVAKAEMKKAIEKLPEHELKVYTEFSEGFKSGTKKWYQDMEFSVYEDTSPTMVNALIPRNHVPFERIYSYTGKIKGA